MYNNERDEQLFCFESSALSKEYCDEKEKNAWHVYVDGAARKNPGPAGAGIFITKNGVPQLKKGFFLGFKTNNQAEYLAFLLGVYHLRAMLTDTYVNITCYSDSLLMVKQLNGHYRVVDQKLKKFFDIAKNYIGSLPMSIIHVPREKNIEADEAANWGIDKKVALPESFLSMLPSE
ncbi:MAG TPA: ribonuclease HI family protein [Patescibacteria group bacterium]|jgi:ribonuclease HI|nr:ribonuclease HI family protein [Patescibacteria group bacterium]